MNVILQEYRLFLAEVDEQCARLAALLAQYLHCRKGCSGCCTDLSVLPIEWYSIQKHLNGQRERLAGRKPQGEGVCPFLVDRTCSIYPFRPLICRAHGLPLVYRVKSYETGGRRLDTDEWQTCWCGLNFTGFTPETFRADFGEETVLNMEELNGRLLNLNRRFLQGPEGKGFRRGRRIELAALLE
jgi:Fe-S-cluster containining protein